MRRYNLMALMALMALLFATSCANQQQNAQMLDVFQSVLTSQLGQQSALPSSNLTDADIVLGLKDALNVGTANVVSKLGAQGGFELDPKVHIPLPQSLSKLDSALKLVGYGHLTADLEKRMNNAAELATPKAKALFIDSVKQMTFSDAKNILFSGQQDAATQFFRQTMGAKLVQEVKPIIGTTLNDSGAIKAFDAALGQYSKLPLVPDVKADLNDYVANKATDGIFYYIAQEEAAIRQNPAKRTTEILKRVFGAN